MFTLSNVRTPNMTWITETIWTLKGIFFGTWRSLKWCRVITEMMQYLWCCIPPQLSAVVDERYIGYTQNHGQVVSDSQVGMKSEGCKEKKTEMDWISSGSLSGWKCNLLQATQGRPNILPRHFSHRLVSVEMRDGDVLVQVALWVFLKDCKVPPCKSSTDLCWGHMGQ